MLVHETFKAATECLVRLTHPLNGVKYSIWFNGQARPYDNKHVVEFL